MTWEIVVGLIALLSAVIAIGTVISNNTRAMTEVKCSINELSKNMTKQTDDTEKMAKRIDEHEIRITIIEEKEGVRHENHQRNNAEN